jgi:hypothetical protein
LVGPTCLGLKEVQVCWAGLAHMHEPIIFVSFFRGRHPHLVKKKQAITCSHKPVARKLGSHPLDSKIGLFFCETKLDRMVRWFFVIDITTQKIG